jgi:hypothetical protein
MKGDQNPGSTSDGQSWQATCMKNPGDLSDQLFDFATKVADDDCGLSRQQLVMEARTLLGRTYTHDDESNPQSDQ